MAKGRVKPNALDPIERKKLNKFFWNNIANLKDEHAVKNFFSILLSESETIMLARRLKIAQFLLADMTYDQIQTQLGVSHATIAKMERTLNKPDSGYTKSIKQGERRLRKIRERKNYNAEPFSYEWIKQRYPLHFLLFNILDEVKYKQGRKRAAKKKLTPMQK